MPWSPTGLGPLFKANAANQTVRDDLAESWAMGVGLRPIKKSVDLPPNLKVTRNAFLAKLRGQGQLVYS